ncbi:mitotic checkpoint serine/threonine-protein kinase BUB1 [Lampris incognitus]|uniref:mitotic checkpoint serine/threonine-protein kinase BUB1 n=1 Tax=Lampris incognitus TaxID=2546036 RepID=UPI0024B4FE2D|nr:mitotic checkpoint serine/threonine-protein kinase BUB1 [Lampris incognitus]
MDVAVHLQCFENQMSTYTGDDPLDPWDRFVGYLEGRLPASDAQEMSVVLDRLVKTFMHDKRYSDDIRYINHCIKCSRYYAEPITLYSYFHGKGIGTRTGAFYVAWAQQFEKGGLKEQADAVYMKAMENQAQPADYVLHEYRLFQMRTSTNQAAAPDGPRPLQNSNVLNHMPWHREPVEKSKGSMDSLSQPPADKTVRIISRSENSGVKPPMQGLQFLSMYKKEDLVCEGSELSFEEVRAARYFLKLKQEKEQREIEANEPMVQEQEKGIINLKQMLEGLNQNLEACGSSTSDPSTQQGYRAEPAGNLNPTVFQESAGRPLVSRPSEGWKVYSEQGFNQENNAASSFHRNHNLMTPFSDSQSSEISRHPPVLADRSIHSSDLAPSSAFAIQAASVTASEGRYQPAQEPVSFESSYSVPQGSMNRDGRYEGDRDQLRGAFDCVTSSSQHCTIDGDLSLSQAPEPEEKSDVSQGGIGNLSYITPNTSLGLVHATPSRVLPSPTVNTREALDVIMDMFQAPTLLDNLSMNQENDCQTNGKACEGGASFLTKAASARPFTIFQDNADKENCYAAAAAPGAVIETDKAEPAVSQVSASNPSRPDVTSPEFIPDESTVWGAHNNFLAACPNSSSDFAMAAQMVSTPFAHKAPYFNDFYHDQENHCPETSGNTEAKSYSRQPQKLSPILEQSPPEEVSTNMAAGPLRVLGAAGQGTIVGEGLILAQPNLTASLTMVPPPPAVLSFRDQTLVNPNSTILKSPHEAPGPSWQVYVSPEHLLKTDSPLSHRPKGSVDSKSQSSILREDCRKPASPEQAQKPIFDIPMSPESAPRSDWLAIKSPEVAAELDLDMFMSPHHAPREETQMNLDVLRSPQQPRFSSDVPMSPAPPCHSMDKLMSPAVPRPMKSPEVAAELDLDAFLSPHQAPREETFSQMKLDVLRSPQQPKFCSDVPMSPAPPCHSMDKPSPAVPGPTTAPLISNPWDSEMIDSLLSRLSSPLTANPNYFTWQCKVPKIAPKTTVTMGKASLRVDRILGEGAFATAYEATEPTTLRKVVLKVQKPANPWEFHISTQVDARVQPCLRHLYNNIHSAHLFQNGSIMLGELYSCGTLLNAINMYKMLSDKVMPQPLVMYFTTCILHMVEQLHSVNIIHADIKPDNFLLGQSFLESRNFDPDHLDHGLTLIDMGRSIDMELFPENTAFTTRCMTSGFQCTEMLSGRPWNYQTDYFGIAGTVYCMLFGTYMQLQHENGVWKTNAVFRRNPHSDLWLEFFHILLNIPDCRSLPCLQSLRARLNSVLQQNYSSKLAPLKNRLVVLLLENMRTRR